MGSHLLQGILPTQGLSRGLWHGRQIVYPLSYKGSPVFFVSETKPTKTASRPTSGDTTKAHKIQVFSLLLANDSAPLSRATKEPRWCLYLCLAAAVPSARVAEPVVSPTECCLRVPSVRTKPLLSCFVPIESIHHVECQALHNSQEEAKSQTRM